MKCVVCSGIATSYNKTKQPVCSRHIKSKVKNPICPDCGLLMILRNGKFGAFWGCITFPTCMGLKKI